MSSIYMLLSGAVYVSDFLTFYFLRMLFIFNHLFLVLLFFSSLNFDLLFTPGRFSPFSGEISSVYRYPFLRIRLLYVVDTDRSCK